MKYVELFCGAGGTSCGLTEAGWECVGAVDLDATARATYARNFPAHPLHALDLAQPLDADLARRWRAELAQGALVASSPCTDFSTANASPRDRSSLTATLAEHVVALQPAWVVFENVPRARNSAEFSHFLNELIDHGYTVAHGVVSALDAGLAQTRKRLFLFAAKHEEAVRVAWRTFSDGLAAEGVARGRAVTMRECFASAGVACPTPFVYLPSCDEKRRKSIYSLDGPAPTVRGYLRPLRATYPFPPRDDARDPAQIFAATPEHTSALQGFPPDFCWVGSKTARARCIGNAVPPPLARRAASAIDRCAREAPPRIPQDG